MNILISIENEVIYYTKEMQWNRDMASSMKNLIRIQGEVKSQSKIEPKILQINKRTKPQVERE